MSIIQISKQQQRSGNLVDLPQLSEGELGWASDAKLLYIGKETPNENIEVLTSYSTIDFSQIEGSIGNLNISNTAANGQVLVYNGTDWVNRGGAAGGLITLGNVANLSITGGAINYTLTTDGTGNLSWTPKNSLYTNIANLTPDASNVFGFGANAIIMRVSNTTPYTNGTDITISGVQGTGNSTVNSKIFYVKLANDYPTSGNTILFNTSDLANANVFINGTITYTNSPNGIATTQLGGTGTGSAGGTSTSVQYNSGVGFAGDSNFTWTGSLLTVIGNANIGNVNATGTVTATRLISNIATGTAPFTVTSTTQVANLNVATSGTAGTVTTNAQPNITSVGTLTSLTVTGNISGGNLIGSLANGNSNVNIPVANGNVNITSVGNTTLVITGTGANIAGTANITGNLTSANANLGNLARANFFQGDGGLLSNISASAGTSLVNGTSNVVVTPSSNITMSVAGSANVVVVSITGVNVAGTLNATEYVIRSITTSISAAGTVQANATALTKDINVVSTVSAGQGVRLPTAVAGMVLIVNNTSAANLNVYPATGGVINSLATNAAYTHVPAASLQYYAVSTTQWYTVGATYA